MTKHPTLFGRKMRYVGNGYYQLGDAVVWFDRLYAKGWLRKLDLETGHLRGNAQKAARALERKIVAAHRRLGKLMAGTKGRSK